MSQPQSPPPTARSQRLSRDQCVQIRALHEAGISQTKIADQLGITRRQVGYSLRRKSATTPQKVRSREPMISSTDVDDIEAFIHSSLENRKMSYYELAYGPFQHLGVSERVIKNELEKRGYKRHLLNLNSSALTFEEESPDAEYDPFHSA
ncbi:hypothetical protein K3495_g4489 [Podosphaera aphanis]|nr:hypothetical protein K3495_g4489 [Podosphaera aphanis]